MRFLIFFTGILIAILLAQNPVRGADKPEQIDVEKTLRVLKMSKDRDELEQAAIDLCRSKDVKAIDALVTYLEDPAFWSRLDPEEDYKKDISWMRITDVLGALGKVGTPQAEDAILKLATSKRFCEARAQFGGLMNAASWIHQPSGRLVRFAEGYLKPDNYGKALYALENMKTSESAAVLVKFFEKQFASDDFGNSGKRLAFTLSLLPVRNDPVVLAFARRVLMGKIEDAAARNEIVLSLFDYRPSDWYEADLGRFPKPPPLKDASTEALKEMLSLADLALSPKLDLTKDTKTAVEKAKKEIQGILDERMRKK